MNNLCRFILFVVFIRLKLKQLFFWFWVGGFGRRIVLDGREADSAKETIMSINLSNCLCSKIQTVASGPGDTDL